jgi:hypothetical protein
MALSCKTPVRSTVVAKRPAVAVARPSRALAVRPKALLEPAVAIGGSTIAFLTLVRSRARAIQVVAREKFNELARLQGTLTLGAAIHCQVYQGQWQSRSECLPSLFNLIHSLVIADHSAANRRWR